MDTIDELNEYFTQPVAPFIPPACRTTRRHSTKTSSSDTNHVVIPIVSNHRVICPDRASSSAAHEQASGTNVSCFERFRENIAKLFGKVMSSVTPSEEDRYDYYDCLLCVYNKNFSEEQQQQQ